VISYKVVSQLNNKSMEETVTISKKEYESLLEDQWFLQCLQRAGVDNWNGYDYAVELSQEEAED
jgi:hypothetical protein